jgi:ankyrin repeat protein
MMAAGSLMPGSTAAQNAVPDRGPRLDPDLVREFVIAGHGNLDRTRELLEKTPALINAAWDWGGGDWETALGGASHMGNKAIADFLLAKGARMDVFCAAATGRIEIVKAFLADEPKVIDLKGPHGIPLLRHAEMGKQEAVVELLRKAAQG